MKKTTEDQITATRTAIEASAGNLGKAAVALGITRQALHRRVEVHPACWPENLTRRKYGTLRTLTNEYIAGVVQGNGGSIAKAATALGVSTPTLREHLKRSAQPKVYDATIAIPPAEPTATSVEPPAEAVAAA